MKQKVISKVKLADNREVRVIRITTHAGSVLRVGTHLLPSGDPMSGVTFPETALDDVINAMRQAASA